MSKQNTKKEDIDTGFRTIMQALFPATPLPDEIYRSLRQLFIGGYALCYDHVIGAMEGASKGGDFVERMNAIGADIDQEMDNA